MYFIESRLVLIPYQANKVDDLIVGSLALVRSQNDMYFITEDIKNIEKQLEDASGTFISKQGGEVELLKMYLVSDAELRIGDFAYDIQLQKAYEITSQDDPSYGYEKVEISNNEIATAIVKIGTHDCDMNADIIKGIMGENNGWVSLAIEEIEYYDRKPKFFNGKARINYDCI